MEQVSNVAYDYVLNKIKSGEWPPGTRIYSEERLCEELAISRISVRAALDKLSALGILKKKKGSGTYVENLDFFNIISTVMPLIALKEYNLRDVLLFRSSFESANIIEFINNNPEKYLPELEAACDIMEQAEGVDDRGVADYEFHAVIARGTENPLIIAIHELLKGIVLPALASIAELRTRDDKANRAAHRILLNVIRDKDSELAALLMRRHIQETFYFLDKSDIHYFPNIIPRD